MERSRRSRLPWGIVLLIVALSCAIAYVAALIYARTADSASFTKVRSLQIDSASRVEAVSDGLVVYEKVIRARVMNELPFMATENIMMDAVKRGGDRQQLHEKLRVHSQAAARVVKEEGGKNDLIDRIASDPAFMVTREEIEAILDPANFTGRSEEQVEEFLRDVIRPVLEANRELLGEKQELSV